MTRGLSTKQEAILRWLLQCYRNIEERGSDRARTLLAVWGVPWCPGRQARRSGREWTMSDSATTSRTVTRLEQRGLIARKHQVTGGTRVTHIRLTEAGRAEAERLTHGQAEHVSR